METLLIGLVLILSPALFFYYRKRKINTLTGTPAGISQKYVRFAERITEQNKSAKVEVIKANSFIIRTGATKNAPVYTITEVSARIIIVWTWTDPTFGPRGKEWSFPDTYNEDKMYEEVIEDVFNYQTEIYRKHNQRMPVQAIQ